jgi:predicted ATPase
VLDDLQWAGADALDLLVSLLRSGGQPPLRLVGAYRETEVGARGAVGEWLAELARDGLATQARLKPLGDDESAELLRAVLQAAPSLSGAANAIPSFALRAVERAEGVPFYVVSFAHALQIGSSEASMLGGVPWDVAQSVRLRLGALPEAAQELLKVAAVAERRVSRRLLEVVMARADGGDGDLLAALEAACEARLLAEAGDDAYRFPYDLVRKVIRADLGAARRAALHRRIAQALEAGEGEAPVEALAYHYARAGEPERAAVYLERAAERARRMQAHATAAGYERELVERLEGLGRHAAAAQARERLGLELTRTADYEEALAVLGRAARTYRDAGDLEGVARVAERVGLVEAQQRDGGRPDPGPPPPGEVAP